MTITEFLNDHGALPEQIPARACLTALLRGMEEGLAGRGNIPMLPSYLSGEIRVEPGARCFVLDAGGTNLRTALAVFDGKGWHLEGLETRPMPGTEGELTFGEYCDALARPLRALGACEKAGFCFSYNVTMDRSLDGTLDFWCKEVRVPEAVGKPVGSSLKDALPGCESVHVLNDSVAAMLGAGDVQVGVILGTGVNVCYREACRNIPKVPGDLNAEYMIVSTEIGEFDGFPKSDFEEEVIAASDAPDSAHAEKQCAGGYLGDVICAAWRAAAREGMLPEGFRGIRRSLADISPFAAGEQVPGIPDSPEAAEIARTLIHRAAKIAAVLCAGPILRAVRPGETARVAVEGSQYWRLSGFRDHFCRELSALLAPQNVGYGIVRSENACLTGAAMAAFAEPM